MNTPHLKSMNTKKGTTTYNVRNPIPGLGQAQKFVNVLMKIILLNTSIIIIKCPSSVLMRHYS